MSFNLHNPLSSADSELSNQVGKSEFLYPECEVLGSVHYSN